MSITSDRHRVVLFGTHTSQMNGYSKCTHALLKRIEAWRGHDKGDIELYHFAFQNFYKVSSHDRILKTTKIFDAFHFEEPKHQGFGFTCIRDFYSAVKPHVVIIYNDMMVVTSVIEQLVAAAQETKHSCKIIVYIDQVYGCQKTAFIDVLNRFAHAIVAFTPSWERCIKSQGLRSDMPTHVLLHGFDVTRNFPIPRHVARKYLGMNDDDFLILNLNRNQPRKRWDICVMAFVEFVANHLAEPVKLIVGTNPTEGAWNITELFFMEFRKRGINVQEGMAHIITIDKPQQLSDEDINVLYNAADVGINTCDGEGLGLCNFEQAALGVPQIVPKLGGFVDVFDDEYALMIHPKLQYYVDSSRDSVGGLADLCDYKDFANALEKYYSDADLRAKHGTTARRTILRDFMWDDVARQFERIIDCYLPEKKPVVVQSEPVLQKSGDHEPASQWKDWHMDEGLPYVHKSEKIVDVPQPNIDKVGDASNCDGAATQQHDAPGDKHIDECDKKNPDASASDKKSKNKKHKKRKPTTDDIKKLQRKLDKLMKEASSM